MDARLASSASASDTTTMSRRFCFDPSKTYLRRTCFGFFLLLIIVEFVAVVRASYSNLEEEEEGGVCGYPKSKGGI